MTNEGPDLLSASSVTTFLRCGRQWYFAYVAGIRLPPTLKQARGVAVHKAVEINMAQKVSSTVDLPVEDVIDAYDTAWRENGQDGFAADATLKEGEVKDKGQELIVLYHTTVAPKIQPIWVEQSVQFKINGIPFSGQIDQAEEVPGPRHAETLETRLVIRDTKTTARKPNGESYLLNMTGYALAARQLTGEKEADTVLDYLVATKVPQYQEVRMGGPITDAQINRFATVVEDVSAAISAGRFTPNGLVSGACSWCGFRPICPAYAARDEMA